jgi:hypothetical protein
MADDLYERIQQRAYEIWENEGRPEGAASRHWDQALDELAGEDEHETMQDLIDEDDREDDERARSSNSQASNVEITTGAENERAAVRSVEGP